MVAKTDPSQGAKGISLIVVEEGTEGFSKGRNLKKLGQAAADTSELFFEDCRVPAENLVGEEGRGFVQLMQQLPQERLNIAQAAVVDMERAITLTLDFVKERKAFGQRVLDFQNTKFKLAECKTEALIARTFVDQCLVKHLAGELDAVRLDTFSKNLRNQRLYEVRGYKKRDDVYFLHKSPDPFHCYELVF